MPGKRRKRRRRRRRRSSRTARLLRRAGVLVVLAAAVWLGYEAWMWPDVAGLARRNPDTTAFIERAREQARADQGPPVVASAWVDYAHISPHLKRAVVAAEDIGFFSHRGFAVAEIKNAVEEALREREMPRGASTITQQLAKNLWLSPARALTRKLREALLTWQLERTLDKRRILELYLNVAEFGPHIFGAEAAARHYFGKPAATLTAREAAQLAAGLPRPRTWHPGSRSAAYRRHVARIEQRMARAEWLWKVI